mmetsp:Transcript_15740/g.15877  ORF Transcript_15740/g.15877 Transcript_15740/m.15877 type:complete len:213 (+) Transcript_15740:248-886(+)
MKRSKTDLSGDDIAEDARDEQNLEDLSIRAGKWSKEEEEYAKKLLELFNTGQLMNIDCQDQSLRSFLARKLKCPRNRISKKFSCIQGLAARYCPQNHPPHVFHNQQKILEALEYSFLKKDMNVQNDRIKRRKYRENSRLRTNQQELEDLSSALIGLKNSDYKSSSEITVNIDSKFNFDMFLSNSCYSKFDCCRYSGEDVEEFIEKNNHVVDS